MWWQRLSYWIVRNGLLKVFSLAFAFGLWLLVNAGERDTEQTMLLPVELRNLPPQLVVVGQRVESVDVRLSGPRTLLGQLGSKKVSLDLAGVRPGPSSFRVTTELLSLPRGVKLLRVTPSVIGVDIARMTKRIVPVRVDLVGTPPFGYRTGEIEVSPPTIEVSGPVPQIEKLHAIFTEAVDMSRLTESLTQDLQLLGPEGELVTYNAERVRAHIDVHEVQSTREFRRLRAVIKNTTYRSSPPFVLIDVSVRGPQRLVEKMSLSSGEVFVDANGQGVGTVILPVSVLLPPGVELVAHEPSEVEVRLMTDNEPRPATPPRRGKQKKSGA